MTGLIHSVLIFLDDDRQSFRICSDESSPPSYYEIESHYSITYEWAWIKYVVRKFLENIFCENNSKLKKIKKLWRVLSFFIQSSLFLPFHFRLWKDEQFNRRRFHKTNHRRSDGQKRVFGEILSPTIWVLVVDSRIYIF